MKQDSISDKKILVTGSSGFIGSHIINKLPKSCVVTDKINEKIIDLRNRNEVVNTEPVDIVIHTAGKIPQVDTHTLADYFDNNTSATLNILEYCLQKKVKKLIFVSTYVYGYPKYCPVDEIHPVNPQTPYTMSKYLSELLCKTYSDNSDLKVTILRPFNIFGKSQRLGFLIPNLVDAIKNGTYITITNKESKRDYLHIDDFVSLIIKILDVNYKFETFNVGTGISYAFSDIVKHIEDITDKKFNINYNENQKTYINEIKADITKIKNKFDWQPRITLEEGLRMTLF